uniref:Uncharacterized protein n=1 Tax=Rhizophora mucronata TaxID=61149 RepID=A0A2P2NQW0_RHIMU
MGVAFLIHHLYKKISLQHETQICKNRKGLFGNIGFLSPHL